MNTSKSVLLTVVLTMSVATTSATAGDFKFSAANGSTATHLCLAAVDKTKVAMYNEIKNSGWSKRFVMEHVKCNHVSIGSFVAQYGSAAMREYIPLNTKVEIIDLAQVSGLSGEITVRK